MRIPRALSPSAYMLWEKDPTEYATRYLVDNKPPRSPQPLPASVGSAFDAVVKSKLADDLFGADKTPDLEFEALFESQVESHNRDEARAMGWHVFENYEATGSYSELLAMMQGAQEAPQFEFDKGATIEGVPLFGKPDCRFVSSQGIHIILDWKVRGYCSKYSTSPMKGFVKCRDGLDWIERNLTVKQLEKRAAGEEVVGKQSRNHDKPHNLYLPMDHLGMEINEGFLETCNEEWATQLSIYGWLLGEKVGDENVVVCIDEVVCKPMGENERPLIRIANHKARVSRAFQERLFASISSLWDAIQSGWVFKDMTREDSDELFEMLQSRANGMASDGTGEEDWFSQLGRPGYR